MTFEEVDVSESKPEYRGWFNMTAECLPRAMGRCWFDGKKFHFSTAECSFTDLLNDGAKVYWLRGTTL